MFEEGSSIMINGAEFGIEYNTGDITLRQLTAIPEPSTYALWGAVGLTGLVVLRRKKKSTK